MKTRLALETITALYIYLFLYAAITKLLDYQQFIGQIGKSPLLNRYAGTVAWTIPSIEIIIAIFLMIPRYRARALYAAYGLMMMFTCYIAAILLISTKLPCACGGILSSLGWKEHLVFNFTYVVLGLVGIVLSERVEKNEVSKIATA